MPGGCRAGPEVCGSAQGVQRVFQDIVRNDGQKGLLSNGSEGAAAILTYSMQWDGAIEEVGGEEGGSRTRRAQQAPDEMAQWLNKVEI